MIAQANDTQAIENYYAYTPYGETTALGPDGGNPIQYTARENDGGLYYYRARYYDPILKRFIAEDPIGLAGGVNTYSYVEGNPVSNADPSGTVIPVVIAAGSAYVRCTAQCMATSAVMAALPGGSGLDCFNVGDEAGGCLLECLNPFNWGGGNKAKGLGVAGKRGPTANKGNAKPHGGKDHNIALDRHIDSLKKDKGVDPNSIRKNQVQVDANGNRVGNNRPDIQYNSRDGRHHNIEYDTSAANGQAHRRTIMLNDPSSKVYTYPVP